MGRNCDHNPPREGSCHECCKDSLTILREKHHALEARLAAVEDECADLIAGKEYQAMQSTLGEVNARLAEAERKLARWEKLRPLASQISDPDLRGIVVSFLDRFAYGESKYDMQADINRAQRATDSAPAVRRCIYCDVPETEWNRVPMCCSPDGDGHIAPRVRSTVNGVKP